MRLLITPSLLVLITLLSAGIARAQAVLCEPAATILPATYTGGDDTSTNYPIFDGPHLTGPTWSTTPVASPAGVRLQSVDPASYGAASTYSGNHVLASGNIFGTLNQPIPSPGAGFGANGILRLAFDVPTPDISIRFIEAARGIAFNVSGEVIAEFDAINTESLTWVWTLDRPQGDIASVVFLGDGYLVTAIDWTRCKIDSDDDGVPDDADVCPGFSDAFDVDGDGVPDGCDLFADCDDAFGDDDGDGICDDTDLCQGDNDSGDSDGDKVCDTSDMCDGDDATGDSDADLVCDDVDICPGYDDSGEVDTSGNGVCDRLSRCEARVQDAPADAFIGDNLNTYYAGVALSVVDPNLYNDGGGFSYIPGHVSCSGCGTPQVIFTIAHIPNGASSFGGTGALRADFDVPSTRVTIFSAEARGRHTLVAFDEGGVELDRTTIGVEESSVNHNVVLEVSTFANGPLIDHAVLFLTTSEDEDYFAVRIHPKTISFDSGCDEDADFIQDHLDLCPGFPDSDDDDGDGVPTGCDLCTGDDASGDADNDNVCDSDDTCMGDDASGDTDGDGICDDSDICFGDNLTGDDDDDGTCNDMDSCVGDDASGDLDQDGVCVSNDVCSGDDATGDSDDDGLCDDVDLCLGDNSGGDADGDGFCDIVEFTDGGASFDGGDVFDAGTVFDAGAVIEGGTDAGNVSFDAGTVFDAGAVVDDGETSEPEVTPPNACGCSGADTDAPTAVAWAAFALLGVFGRRRRRRAPMVA